MSGKRMINCETNEELTKKVKYQVERPACFTDLPNEIILLICRYLTAVDVLVSFLELNKRLYCCISEYHQTIDLTYCSCQDFSFYMMLFQTKRIHPTTIIVSNSQLIKQIEIFLERILPSITYDFDYVEHLSLLECPIDKLFSINSKLSKFKSLQTLRIVQAVSDDDELPTSYSILEEITHLLFYNSFKMLNKVELIIDDGLILGKQLPPNRNLQYLIITLQNINDLYVLLDGLMPNLILLHVTICQSAVNRRFLLPKCWPSRPIVHLREFQLTTNENVSFSFDQLCNIVIPLIQLDVLVLYIREWISNDQQFIQGNQLQMLFEQFLPRLNLFVCSIRTIDDIDMQSFLQLSQRWPMKCRLESNSLRKHLYTIPWSFRELNLSMLANDDTKSVYPNVRYLTVDVPSTSINLSQCFPNLYSLTILREYHLSHNNYLGFRQLRHLTMNDINTVPSSIIQSIHTMTLFNIDNLSTHSLIYPKMKSFTLENDQTNSFATVKTVIRHFPNLRSLKISLQHVRNAEYYDSLNILLDGEHLSHLLLLKSNWNDDQTYDSKVSLWLSSRTSMKWRSTIFCAYHDENELTICL